MNIPWNLDVNLKDVVLDFSWLSLLLIVGAVLRRYIPFFQRYLVPNNIIAGFVGLIIGPQLLGLSGMAPERLGLYVYHLLALVFIAMGLRQGKSKWGSGPVSMGLAFVTTYLVQGTVGVGVALLMAATFWPDLFIGIGLLVPLGFGMGPGLAYTMGNSWEAYGFSGGGVVGLTFAAIGFLIAYFVGIPLVNRAIARGTTTLISGTDAISDDVRRGLLKEPPALRSAGKLTIASEAMEPMAFQLGLIGGLYLITYAITYMLNGLMVGAGLQEFTATLWSFHFILAAVIAMLFRKGADMTGIGHLIDKGLMTRSAGVFMDYLVAASIAAISVTVVWRYWQPIALISLSGGLATYFYVRWLTYRVFDDYHFERFIGVFGDMTGTINSGLVLVRVTDPEFDTPVAEDLVYGSGMALLVGFPLLIVLNLPFTYFANSVTGYWVTIIIFLIYFVVLMIGWRLTGYLRFTAQPPGDGQ